ncbi:response regulator [uncultured Sphingomonas sp.]|uniref:response regulator n=1 Tax=uncultured Sphingomonas sp. TaxID=158754 RepID=UPI0035CAFF1A
MIEDEWIIAEYVAEVARDAGATSVDMAETQNKAVAAAFKRPPSVILSDVRLAEGTGPLAVMAIMAVLGPIPVIFITGTPGDCVTCDYAAAVLTKPLDPHQMIAAFRRVAPAAFS